MSLRVTTAYNIRPDSINYNQDLTFDILSYYFPLYSWKWYFGIAGSIKRLKPSNKTFLQQNSMLQKLLYRHIKIDDTCAEKNSTTIKKTPLHHIALCATDITRKGNYKPVLSLTRSLIGQTQVIWLAKSLYNTQCRKEQFSQESFCWKWSLGRGTTFPANYQIDS